MAFLELNNVSKAYGTGSKRTSVLKNINLHVEEGEFLAIVGYSGSGKSTLINLINGLIRPDEGQVLLNGKPVLEPGPDRGVVFQNYSLLPWLTVYGNVLMAVEKVFPQWDKKQREDHVKKYIHMVNLQHAMDKRPAELSGGMKQRVSVARALAMNPSVLLLDEPLSALDALTRGTLQTELQRIWSEEKKTVIMITNDVDESVLLADRIVPLNPGPDATLGPAFPVSLPRPRHKTGLNSNPEFKKVRNAVTAYLIEAGEARKQKSSGEYVLPDLQPVDLRVGNSVFCK